MTIIPSVPARMGLIFLVEPLVVVVVDLPLLRNPRGFRYAVQDCPFLVACDCF